jgi:thymidylate kinase
MIIALIGADGTGKTSLGLKLVDKYSELYTDVEFVKSFEEYFVLKNLLKLFKRQRQEISQDLFFKMVTPPPWHIKVLWPIVVYFDQLLLYFYLSIFKRNTIIITDRYPYSFWVTWSYYKMTNSLINKLYLSFPRPEYCIVLKANPSLLIKRKSYQKRIRNNSYNLNFFNDHAELYDIIAKKLNLLEVDTSSKSVDEVALCIYQKIKL